MKIWIAEQVYAYDGSTLLGAFSDEEKAKEACQTHCTDRNSDEPIILEWGNLSETVIAADERIDYSWYAVICATLDEIIP